VGWVYLNTANAYPSGRFSSDPSWDCLFKVWIAPTSPVESTLAVKGGKVGVRTLAPDQALSVNGDASKLGGTTWQTFSDGRLKTVLGRYTPGLSAVLALDPVQFRYRPDNPLGLVDEGVHTGFVAQEVQKVLPGAVAENGDGYLMLKSDPILWAMLNATKEQHAVVQEQRARIERQERLLAEQQKIIAALLARVSRLESTQPRGR
ncbi:MAG: tail fiber domain-containing protein, partial [Planctomycetes bacterium]|nr:tail fiber domain-containing protein [Planctomycetota bacterium]